MKMRPKLKSPRHQLKIELMTVTPQRATAWIEGHTDNRPLSDGHVRRIADQIKSGKWKVNADTIKFTDDGQLIDGQHRLWAIIEANIPVDALVATGVDRDAFATIDTLRKVRSGADIIALSGTTRYRNVIASALTWLLRWQSGNIIEYRAPENKIENSDIEAAFRNHPEIVRAVERAMCLRRLANVSIMSMIYYVLAHRNMDVAERMMSTLENPAKVPLSDPFFRLRNFFTSNHHMRKDPVITIALAIKAANAVGRNKKIESLSWKSHGRSAEPFPTLDVGK